jgi:hypothetical protein
VKADVSAVGGMPANGVEATGRPGRPLTEEKSMIRRNIAQAFVLLGALVAGAPAGATDVGVSIQISQPGVYGRIDIGQFPKPQVVVAQPVIVLKPPPQQVVVAQPQPVYMWVPPGHRKNWRKHCREYGACGVPVLFVEDRWYDDNVKGKGKGKGQGKGHGKGKDD